MAEVTNNTVNTPLLDMENKPMSLSSLSATLRNVGCLIVSHFRDTTLVAGPVLFVILMFTLKEIEDEASSTKRAPMAATMAWMFIWWITEAVPFAITGLIPLFAFPFLEIETASTVSKSYTNDTIFLILGAFILAEAVRFHDLHKRFAIQTVLMFKNDPRLLLFGFCVGSAFISMWVDNSAACAMLMPIVTAVQQKVHAGFQPPDDEQKHTFDLSKSTPNPALASSDCSIHGSGYYKAIVDVEESHGLSTDISQLEREASIHLERHISTVLESSMDLQEALKFELNFCRGTVISVAFGVTIGGMATLTGTAVNLVFTGIWETSFPAEKDIYYFQWMLFAFPLALILTLVMWILVCIFFCPPSAVKPVSVKLHSLHMEDELVKMGPMTSDQVTILVIFLILIILWMTKTFSGESSGWGALFDDYPGNGSITILAAVLLFVIPNPRNPKAKLLNWSQCKDIPWQVLLLLGGGFALADGLDSSGLSDVIAEKMEFLQSIPYWAITPAVAILTSIVTEFTSNSVTAALVVPLCVQIALSINIHPLYLMVPATISAQFSYMFPIATVPNAMAFATDFLRTIDMLKPGIILKAIAIILLSVLMPTLGVVVFNTNSTIST